jgi:hypothetical protein
LFFLFFFDLIGIPIFLEFFPRITRNSHPRNEPPFRSHFVFVFLV